MALFLLLLLNGAGLGQQLQSDSHRKAIEKVAPHYPEMAKTLKLKGIARVVVRVAANGRVVSAEVMGGHPLLAQAAVDAVRLWRFEAAPQETEEVVSFTFQP